jgi:hypothetical protein
LLLEEPGGEAKLSWITWRAVETCLDSGKDL